jgi:transposase InsO family protein
VTDVFSRRIVGWNVASTLKADILPLQALNMAAWAVDGHLDGLVHHADHGSSYLAVVYTDRIEELGARPSTGTVGDSFDNAMAEAVKRALQDRADLSRRPLAHGRAGRARDARVRVVVEQPAPPRRARHAHPRRGRSRLLRWPRHTRGSDRFPNRPIGMKLRANQASTSALPAGGTRTSPSRSPGPTKTRPATSARR